MKSSFRIVVLFVIMFSVVAQVEWHRRRIVTLERQIDQLCQGVFTLAREQGAREDNGFSMGKEYCFFFADYDRSLALVGEFDGKIMYDKKPQLVIIKNVREDILDDWNKSPTEYGYKKIR
jgi:hypothetical protein